MRVLVDRDDRDRPARPQHARDLRQRRRRAVGVGQHVQEERLVERRGRRGDRVQVAVEVADVRRLGESGPRRGQHPVAPVEQRVRLRPRRHELGDGAVARAGVEHVAELQQADEAARERVPRAPGRIVALHLAGERIGPREVAGTRSQQRVAALAIGAERRIRHLAVEHRPHPPDVIRHGAVVDRVHGRAALAAVAQHAGILESAEMRRHPRLRQTGDGGEVGDRQRMVREQRHQAHPGGVAEEVERIQGGRQLHHGILMI